METRRSRIARALGALGMLAVFSAASRADHYYVGDDDDDANSGTAPDGSSCVVSIPPPDPDAEVWRSLREAMVGVAGRCSSTPDPSTGPAT